MSDQSIRVREISAALLKVVNKLSNALKSVRYAVGVNLMNDRRQIAEDHPQGSDVVANDGKVELNLNRHSSSPVLCDSFTVERHGGCGSPQTMPGVAVDLEGC